MRRTRKLVQPPSGGRSETPEPGNGNEIEVFIKIGLRSRATAPGPTCSASGSLIRARHRVRRGGVPPIGRAYRSLLSTASDGTDPEAPSRWDGPGSSSIRLLAEGKRLRSRENGIGVIIKIGLTGPFSQPRPPWRITQARTISSPQLSDPFLRQVPFMPIYLNLFCNHPSQTALYIIYAF